MHKCFLVLFFVISLSTAFAQSAKLKALPVRFAQSNLPSGVQILCGEHYPTKNCLDDARLLKAVLSEYPVDQLGSWSFAIVPDERWHDLVTALGHDPSSPAFSVFNARMTVFESSLFSARPEQTKAFLDKFGLSGPPLLNLAVTHELGHTLCMERDERLADDFGKMLRSHKVPACGVRGSGPGRGK